MNTNLKKEEFHLLLGRLKQLANIVLLILMLGAVYTHYTLHDKFERMAPGLVFSLLLLTRLIIYRQVKQREDGSIKEKKITKSDRKDESESEPSEDKSQGENDDQIKTLSDKRRNKKNE